MNLSLDLLNYAKSIEINNTLCDPNQPPREVFDLLKTQAQNRGVQLELNLAPNLKPFYFDSEKVHLCLTNLVTNAIDACSDALSRNQPKEVHLKTVPAPGWGVEYQIVDNGIGMAEDVQNKLFRIFFTTKGTQGTGIGLMITKKIIDELKGVIKAESEKGRGSVFFLRIPVLSHPA